MIEIDVRNVVRSGSLGAEMPLEEIVAKTGAGYEPELFPGIKMRLGGCTVQVFATGSVTVVGATTAEMAINAIEMLVDLFKRHDIAVGTVTHGTHNVVATADLGRSLDLDPVVMTIPRSLYEPEHFPGVIIRRQNPKCTILLFASGRLVCIGADSEEAASLGVNQLYADLVEANTGWPQPPGKVQRVAPRLHRAASDQAQEAGRKDGE